MSSQALPIFYINLASRPDRREHVERQLSALGLSGTRVEAVTAAECGNAPGSLLSPGELGCSRSHQKVWRMLGEQNIAAALILEDDVVLSRHLPAVLADPRLLHGIDVLQLEARQTSALIGRPVATAVEAVARGRLMSSSLGSAAYLMTMELAQALLRRPDVDDLPLDTLLFGRPGSLFYEANVFQIVPALAIQLDQTVAGRQGAGRSDLDDRRGPFSARDRRTSEGRLRRALRHWGHHLRVVGTFGGVRVICGEPGNSACR